MNDSCSILHGGIVFKCQISPKNKNDEGNIQIEDLSSLGILSKDDKTKKNTLFNPANKKITKREEIKILEENNKNNKTNGLSNENSCSLGKNSFPPKYSFFARMLISTIHSRREKIIYFFKHFIIVHILVICFTIFKIYVQEFTHKRCWAKNLCDCPDFQIKLISTLFNIFSMRNINFLFIFQTSVEVLFESKFSKIMAFLLHYALFFVFSFYIYLERDYIEDFTIVNIIMFVPPLVFQILSFFKLNFHIWKWFQHIIKINMLPILIFFHHYLCYKLFPKLNSYLEKEYSTDMGRNFIELYQFFYFQIFCSIFERLLQIYNKYIISFPNNDVYSTITAIRFGSIFFVSVPLAGILGMEKSDDWGGYLLLISYTFFLFSFYTRVNIVLDFLKFLLSKIWSKIKYKKPKIEDENNVIVAHLLSGCMLDLVVIVNSRLIILMITKTWITYPVFFTYYLGCGFNFSTVFHMNYLAAWGIIAINTILTGFLIVYMVLKKEILFDYKKPKNFLVNFYSLFLNHMLLENIMQLIIGINDMHILNAQK